jgi:lysophospholipid acyltransferase (LPLAT)-like uncharacterized protein
MMAPSDLRAAPADRNLGRNFFVRTVDALLALLRRYALPLHWLVIAVGAMVLFAYIRLVAFTARLRTAGERQWPSVLAPSVLALWHRDAPSLLVAFAKRRPRSRSVIMIAGDPRGDCLALVCRMLGLAVVRGGGTESGWNVLVELAQELAQGACVIVTADGGGPARIAKVGAVALASAAGLPLVPLSAHCHPAIEERHKWDAARNPIPFSSVTVSIGPERSFERFADLSSIEQARHWLEETLDALASENV